MPKSKIDFTLLLPIGTYPPKLLLRYDTAEIINRGICTECTVVLQVHTFSLKYRDFFFFFCFKVYSITVGGFLPNILHITYFMVLNDFPPDWVDAQTRGCTDKIKVHAIVFLFSTGIHNCTRQITVCTELCHPPYNYWYYMSSLMIQNHTTVSKTNTSDYSIGTISNACCRCVHHRGGTEEIYIYMYIWSGT